MAARAQARRPGTADVARMSAAELEALEAAIKERRKILRQAATRLPRLEERRAALGDVLASAVDFGLRKAPGETAGFEAVVIARAEGAAAVLKPAGVIRWSPVRRWLAVGAVGACLLAALGALWPGGMGLWFGRNVLLSARDWPRATRLAFVNMPDGVLHVAKGGTATVQVRASGVVPEIARLRIRGESSFRARTAIMDRLGDDVFSTDLPDVTESAGLTVRAGDGLHLVQRAGRRLQIDAWQDTADALPNPALVVVGLPDMPGDDWFESGFHRLMAAGASNPHPSTGSG